ncbi:MAG: 2-amino-4-hydroxy-6-hydroxymethyldihydropteridine diphosphokinase [Nitrincola sp.]|nr:2-amino-4-hydroxy-6-hydroxymethyldihydropteridine diphosphokinase [Nitrincola sp.]
MVRCFIGLGSNLDDPINQVKTALKELAEHSQLKLIQHSPLYVSEPVGPAGQPDYINAAAEIETSLSPEELLDLLQQIEQQHQRVRRERWGPRTLDLDILLYGETELNTERLTIPHPYLTERNFVLRPLADLDEKLSLPSGKKIINYLADCPMGTLVQLSL